MNKNSIHKRLISLDKRDDFIAKDNKIAICGIHIGGDAIHVGIYWNSENEKKIFHFQNGNNIPIVDATHIDFQGYFFNPINDFPENLLPSLAALSELISENKINNLIFNREGVVFNGGKFEFNTGNYPATLQERIVNCGVFVIALLNTYDYSLLNWNTWPNQEETTYLNTWFQVNNIPQDEQDLFYNQAKKLRGRHVLVCPTTETKPSPYHQAEFLSQELLATF